MQRLNDYEVDSCSSVGPFAPFESRVDDSFFTARRRRGIVVPLFGWALLIADVVLMAVTVSS